MRHRCTGEQRELIGFYALKIAGEDEIELGAMFVDPQYIGTGRGRQMMRRVLQHATQPGASRLIIQSDPHAAAFYRAAGAKPYGERESGGIAGRLLPLLRIELPVSVDRQSA